MNRFAPRLLSAALAVSAPAALAGPPAEPEPAFETAHPYEGTWYGRFGVTNCSWIVLDDGVFVIDTGASLADARNLKAEVARTTNNKPVKWIAMTHFHGDSNDGFPVFFPMNPTVFLNAKAAPATITSLAGKESALQVMGVTDRVVLAKGGRILEIGALSMNAHTGSDLYVFDAGARTVWVGDLVTPDRCPMLSDPDSDLKGWLLALDRLDSLKPLALIPTRGNPVTTAAGEISKTRRYLTSMLQFLVEKKKQNAPEARVTGELAGEKIADYCPRELGAINALSVYRRIAMDGTTVPGSALRKAAPK
jgi:glyoxylase-like metal-dependent hydrolase (beta-lactamase superfamily II)